MKRVTLFIIGLFLLLGLSARQVQHAASQDLVRENFSQTYPLAPNGRVSLGNIAGDIRIMAWDRNEVKVEAVKMAYTQERLSEARIEVDAGTDAVRIRTKYPEYRNMNFSYGKDNTFYGKDAKDKWDKRDSAALVEYTLTVPRNATLSDVNSVSGDISLEGVTGELKIASVSGDVKAKSLSSNNVRLSSVSGAVDVALDSTANGQDIQLSSVSGMVVLVLPSDANANVRANTVSGLVRNTFGLPVRVGQYVGRDFAGQLGNGGARIKLNSVSGSVELRRAGDGKTPGVVTNLLPGGNDSRAAAVAEAQADFADLRREHEQDLKEAEKSLKEAEKEFEKVQKAYDQERQRYEEAQRSSDEATRSRARERYEEAQEEYRNAQREFRNTEREFRNVQREHEREVRDAQREQQRAQAGAMREAARASADAAREAARASAELARGMSEGIYVGNHGPLLTERDERTINLSGTPDINLYTDDGAIAVRAWDSQQVKVVFVKRGRDQADLSAFNLTARQNGSNVEIRAEVDKSKRKQGDKGGWYNEGSVGLEVWVPRNVKLLKAHTGDGRIMLEGVAGELDLHTGDGSVDVLRSSGSVKVNTGDGRINVNEFKGRANVRTGDGRIALNGQFEDLSAATGDGNITYAYTDNLNAVIEADCENIVTNGSFSGPDDTPGKKRITIGSGGKTFRFSTGDGKLYLRREN